jgi:hypothetical protein
MFRQGIFFCFHQGIELADGVEPGEDDCGVLIGTDGGYGFVGDGGVVCWADSDGFPKYLIHDRPVRGIVIQTYRLPSAEIPVRNMGNPQLRPSPLFERFKRNPPKFIGFLNRHPIFDTP